MQEPTLFVGIPLHDGRVHNQCMAGCLQAMVRFSGRIAIKTQIGSFLPRNRDILTAQFLDSPCSHMLCLDSDIGWTPDDAQALLDAQQDFVAGCYAKKQPDREIPTKLTGERIGALHGAEYAPAGFMLLSRSCVERMVGAYRDLQYKTQFGHVWALWASLFARGQSYDGEDVSFCRRWTALGGKVWMHRDVVVSHYGELAYVPEKLPG